MRWRWSGSPLLEATVGLVVGELAQGGTRSSRGAQGIWGAFFLYFSMRLWWDVWEKRGNVVWWIGPVLEDSSGIKSWLCDLVKSHDLSEPHVCHVYNEDIKTCLVAVGTGMPSVEHLVQCLAFSSCLLSASCSAGQDPAVVGKSRRPCGSQTYTCRFILLTGAEGPQLAVEASRPWKVNCSLLSSVQNLPAAPPPRVCQNEGSPPSQPKTVPASGPPSFSPLAPATKGG